jgi:triosephosphate isomerase
VKSAPRKVIAGNWKLNHSPAAAEAYLERFLPIVADATAEIVLFPPAISFSAVRARLTGSDVGVGVQNVYWEGSGAFTGEISATLAAEAGASHVLVGHSERRQLFGETDSESARKVDAVLAAGLRAMLCVGETLEEREAGSAEAVVVRQLTKGLEGVAPDSLRSLLIAYEPVWAIGTGRTASSQDASEMHQAVRSFLDSRFGEGAAGCPILYGGSVKVENAAELLAADQVDGLLVGGASLDPEVFASICNAAT